MIEKARCGSLARHCDAQRRGGAKVVTTKQRRQVVTHLVAAFRSHRVSARQACQACRLVGLSRSRWHYRARRALQELLRPIRARRTVFAADPDEVLAMIRRGSQRRRDVVASVLREVRDALYLYDFSSL